MRAVVLAAPGPVEALELREVPVPTPEPGWVLVKVEAFGLEPLGAPHAAGDWRRG